MTTYLINTRHLKVGSCSAGQEIHWFYGIPVFITMCTKSHDWTIF